MIQTGMQSDLFDKLIYHFVFDHFLFLNLLDSCYRTTCFMTG